MRMISVSKNQENINYAIYMIGGSYFKKASCSNTRLETRLRVQYMEQKQEKQAALEEKCIKYFEEKLLKNKALDDVWKQSVDCEFTAHGIRFLGTEYALCVTAEAKGKEVKFFCQLFKKNLWIVNIFKKENK